MTSSSRVVRLGQNVTVNLKIIDQSVENIFYDLDSTLKTRFGEPEFVYSFSVEPTAAGDFYLGPYSLSFRGKPLISNSLTIKVLPEWDGIYGTFFRVDCNEIMLGESIELVVETWSEDQKIPLIEYDRSKTNANVTGQINGSQLKMINTKVYYYRKLSWIITPESAGYFLITEDFFKSIPEGVTPPEIIVNVKEKENEGEI